MAWKALETEFYSPEYFEKQYLEKPTQQDFEKQQEGKKIQIEVGQKRKRESHEILMNFAEKKFKPTNTSQNCEFTRYKELPQVEIRTDPLVWWSENEKNFPVIAEIARTYLAIPASQATCERSFSVAKKICTDDRTALTPEHVEKLTLLRQNANNFYEYESTQRVSGGIDAFPL